MTLPAFFSALVAAASTALADTGLSFRDPPPDAEAPTARAPVSRDTTVRLRAAAWLTQASGRVSAGDEIPGATHTLDLEDTLKLDTDELAVWATLGFNFGKERRWHLDLGYTGHFDYSGDSDPINISFNDRVFTGTVDSHAELDIYEIGLSYDILRAGPVTLSLGGGSRIFDVEASVEGTATDPDSGTTAFRREEESGIVPLPALGGGLRWDITENVYLKGVARGIYAGSYGSFLDAHAEIGFDFTPNIGLFGGYRWVHADADVNDIDFRLDLHGPYAGLEIRF